MIRDHHRYIRKMQMVGIQLKHRPVSSSQCVDNLISYQSTGLHRMIRDHHRYIPKIQMVGIQLKHRPVSSISQCVDHWIPTNGASSRLVGIKLSTHSVLT